MELLEQMLEIILQLRPKFQEKTPVNPSNPGSLFFPKDINVLKIEWSTESYILWSETTGQQNYTGIGSCTWKTRVNRGEDLKYFMFNVTTSMQRHPWIENSSEIKFYFSCCQEPIKEAWIIYLLTSANLICIWIEFLSSDIYKSMISP